MATITNKSNINLNSVSLSSIVNGEGLTIENSTLIINSDNRWGYNGAVIGNIIIDPQVGGSLIIDATKTWELPFHSSSGFVPKLSAIEYSLSAIGLTSGAYGEYLGVWDNTNWIPLTGLTNSSTSLPPSGFIKLRSKTGNFITNEQVKLPNNSTITISNPGKRSWINVACRAGQFFKIDSYLSTLSANGDWYYLDDTNGKHNQNFKIPVKDHLNGLWIERQPNTDIYDRWVNANGLWDKYATSLVDSLSSSLIGTLSSNGRFFYGDYRTTTITIAGSAGNRFYGYLPPQGCKVRIPNIFLSNSGDGTGTANLNAKTGSYSENIINYTRAQKYYADASNLNSFFKTCNINWCLGVQTSPGIFKFENCGIVDCNFYFYGSSLIELKDIIYSPPPCGGPSQYANSGGQARIFLDTVDTVLVDGFYGITSYTSVFGTNILGNNARIFNCIDAKNVTIKNCVFINSIKNLVQGLTLARNVNPALLENIYFIQTHSEEISNTKNLFLKNIYYSNRLNGRMIQGNTIGLNFSNCFNTKIDGFYLIPELYHNLPKDPPAPAATTDISPEHFIYIQGSTDTLDIRNIGTLTEPIAGKTNAYDGSIRLPKGNNIFIRRGFFNTKKIVYNRDGEGKLSENILLENLININPVVAAFDDPNFKNATIKGCLMYGLSATNRTVESPGSHWRDYFTAPNSGQIQLLGNSPSIESIEYIETNLNQNGFYNKSGFMGNAKVSFANAGESITWEMPYHALGHTGFRNLSPSIRGTTTTNLSCQFKYDIDKNGYNNDWLNLTTSNLTGININPSIGIRLKLKVSCIANSNNTDFSTITIITSTNPVSQREYYPLPLSQSGTVSNLVRSSRIQLFNETTNTQLYNDIYSESTTFTYSYNNGEGISPDDILRLRLTYVDGNTAKLRQELKTKATLTGFTFYADQKDDVIYNENNINGSSVIEFNADYPNLEVDVSNALNQKTNVQRLYAWWVTNEYTLSGISEYFGGLIAEDIGNYKISSSIVDLKLDNSTNQSVVFEGDYRLYRDDNEIPVVNSTSGGGSIIMYAGRVNVTVSQIETGISGLTPEESTALMKINTIPQDTFSFPISSITTDNSIGLRLKNSATVSNVAQILSDGLSLS
jgi:hypothetical protein